VFPDLHEAPMFRIFFLTFSLPPWFLIFKLGRDKPQKTKKPAANFFLGNGLLGPAIVI